MSILQRIGGLNKERSYPEGLGAMDTVELKTKYSAAHEAISVLESTLDSGEFGRRSKSVAYYGPTDRAYGFGTVFLTANIDPDKYKISANALQRAIIEQGLSCGRQSSGNTGEETMSISIMPVFDPELRRALGPAETHGSASGEIENKVVSFAERKIEKGVKAAIEQLKHECFLYAKELSSREDAPYAAPQPSPFRR